MNLVTLKALTALTQRHDEPCVSILIPTLRKDGSDQNLIRFKNARSRVERELTDYGLRPSEITDYLNRLEPYQLQGDFWNYVSDGVAFFMSPDFFEIYQFPFQPEELVLVNQQFYVKPIFQLLVDDGRFFLLLLNQRGARLFEGTHHSLRELESHSLPASIEETLNYIDREGQLQLHTGTAAHGGGERSPMVHGHGGSKDMEKTDLETYFRKIDKALHPFLKDQRAPLIVAGVEYHQPLYESANTYSDLVRGMTGGHLENMKISELHQQAWAIVAPRFAERRREAAERYHQLKASRKSSTDLKAVLAAAHEGRVARLFLSRKNHAWGLFEPKTNEMLINDKRQPGDEDLLNTAGIETLLHGGDVFLVDQTDMPESVQVAANFRY